MDSKSRIKNLDEEGALRIEWLRSFLAVIEKGGFTKAARALRLSQPAVSTHIRGLERSLGTRLFEHVGGRVRVTRAGETAAREARRLLEDVRELRRNVGDSEGGVEGVVKIGASTTPGNYLLPPLLARFERAHPRARARLSIGPSGRIMDLLRVNEVDLGVVGMEPDSDEFQSRRFMEDEIVFFAAADHPLARRRRLAFGELAGQRILFREEESATRRLVEGWLTRRRLAPDVVELGSPETVKRVAAAGMGIGVLSRYAIEWEVRLGQLAMLPLSDFKLTRWLYVVHHRRKHLSRSLRALLDILSTDPKP